jgi:hypothetical protein
MYDDMIMAGDIQPTLTPQQMRMGAGQRVTSEYPIPYASRYMRSLDVVQPVSDADEHSRMMHRLANGAIFVMGTVLTVGFVIIVTVIIKSKM